MARGLSLAGQRDLEGALAAFADARKAAEASGTTQGKRVAAIADENAAQALVALGHDAYRAAHYRWDVVVFEV